MGAKMATLSNAINRTCKVDDDCYTASVATTPDQVLLVTDAEKSKACCMIFGVVAVPTGTTAEIAIGDVALKDYTDAGLSKTVGEATKYCNQDYPVTFTDIEKVVGVTNADGLVTFSTTDGALSYKLFCDGGAATLAAATAAVAVATISLY